MAPGVHQLRALACQVFALLERDQVTLIDSGAPGSAPLILRQLRDLGCEPSAVTRVILTHYHIDHRGAAADLRRATGAEVLIHADEAPYLRGDRPYPNPVQDPLRAVLVAPLMAACRGSPLPVQEVNEGDLLDVMGGLRVHHTPGHTRGSIALSLPAQGLLFSGDAMGFRHRRLEPPDWLVSEDTATARASIERLASLDIETICFSHFPALQRHARAELRKLVGAWSGEDTL